MFACIRKYCIFPIGLFVVISALSSCSVIRQQLSGKHVEKVHFVIDETATILPAQYDRNYLLEGNIVARYEDFDFMRVASETIKASHLHKHAGTYSTFEIRNHDGKPLKRLIISPKNNKRLLRFRVNGKNYLIKEGVKDGSHIISRPSHLFA